MSAVFGSNQQRVAGAMEVTGAKLQLDGETVALAQNAQVSFSQQVSMLYEIGTNNVYFVNGRAQGTCTIARIVGPAGAAGALVTALGSVCGELSDVTLAAESCQEGAGTTRYVLSDCLLTTISVSVATQDVVFNERLQMLFINLDIS